MTGKMIYVTKGGPCPVAPEVVVDVKFLRGSNWGPAGCWDWEREPGADDEVPAACARKV